MKIASTIRSVQNYARPRVQPEKGVDTSGDSPELRPGPSVIAGGLQGYMVGKMTGSWSQGLAAGLGGVVGSYTGSKVAKNSGMALGAATGAGVGALTTAAVTAGLSAVSGASFNPTMIAFVAAGGGLAGLAGTLSSTMGGQGVMAGGIQGFMGDRMAGMAAGSIGGYVGLEVGKKTGSSLKAVGAGSLAGAAIGAGATGLLAAAAGQSAGGLALGFSALLGSFAGAVGTMSASRRSAPRDAAYGGLLSGMAAGALIQNPTLGLATAAASSFSTVAKDAKGKAVFGAVSGAVTGALAGSLAGPVGILHGAIAGALVAPAGALLGTSARQVMRNAQHDLIHTVNSKWVDPYLAKNKLNHAQKLAVGGAAFGIMAGTTGLTIEGAAGALALGSIGALAGVAFTQRAVSKAKEVRELQKAIPQYNRPEDMFARVIEAQDAIIKAAQERQ